MKREKFGVTGPGEFRAVLPIPEEWSGERAWPDPATGDLRIASVDEPPFTIALTGQEFLLFRGVRDAPTAHRFAHAYGSLGLLFAELEVRGWPLWPMALSQPLDEDGVGKGYASREPLEDWTRQAGLLDFATGLVGLLTNPAKRRSYSAIMRRVAKDALSLDAQAQLSDDPSLRPLLEGAARAGLRVDAVERQGSSFVVEYEPEGWIRTKDVLEGLTLGLSAAGVSEALAHLLSPWLQTVRADVTVKRGKLAPAFLVPGSLLGVLWLQLANATFSGMNPSLCAWERCPGPPDRPRVFFWRWGRTATGIKHGDAIYCHPKCAHAAAVAASRKRKRKYEEAHAMREEG